MSMADQYDDGRYDPNPGHDAPPDPDFYTPKEAPMPERLTTAEIQAELRTNLETVKALRKRAADLRKMAINALPDEPPADQSRWAIDVRFTRGGNLYEFLVLRVKGQFYTTGTGDNHRFTNWRRFLEWLDGVEEHSALIPLVSDYDVSAPLEGKGR